MHKAHPQLLTPVELPPAVARLPISRTQKSIAVLIGVGLLAVWPVLAHGAPDLAWDGAAHAVWAKQFAIQFWQGDWYPRWFANVNAGFGGPSGFFYPPLTHYASSIFWPLLASRDPDGWRLAGCSLVIGYILSGISAYLWLQSLTQSRWALIGAFAYMIAPYHLAVDLYVRGASAELWVFVWLPLVLLAAEGVLRRSPWAVIGGAISYALAVLSHPSTALCFAPVAVACVIIQSEGRERLRVAALVVASLMLGVALDAVYLLPATLDQHKASVSLYISGLGDYQNNWVLPSRGEISSGTHFLSDRLIGIGRTIPQGVVGYVLILLVTLSTLGAIALLFLVAYRAETTARHRRILFFYSGVALVTFFLMTKPSAFVWQIAGFLKYLQFPSRLNVILTICLAAFSALAAPFLLQPRFRPVMLCLAAIPVGWLATDLWAPTHVFSAWRPDPAKSNWHWIRTQMEPSDMRPKPANEHIPAVASEFDRFVAEHPPKAARVEALFSQQTTGTAQVETWQPRRVLLKIDASQTSVLTVNHFYYEGWQGRISGTNETLRVTPSSDGFIQLTAPQGGYELILELPKDGPERTGKLISLFSVLLLSCLTGWVWVAHNLPRIRRQ